MLRVLALPSADKAWALRELDTAASSLPRGHPSSFASRLAELHAARAALCRAPLYVVAAGEAALARGAWRLCALGISIEVTANGRTKALLLNDVLVGRGLSGAARQQPAPAAEPSLRRFAAMASLPATPPATPATRRLRRTRSSDPVAMQPAPQPAPQRADAPPPQRRLRSAGVMTRAGEAAQQRSASPLFSFRCPITHCVMEDPVVAADGHSYERSAISRWLLRSQRSPCTNVPMSHGRVLPNHSMRAAIAEWRATTPAPPPQEAEGGAAAA